MTEAAYFTDDQFAARTIMAPALVERLQGVVADRGVADVAPADVTAESPFGVVKFAANVVAVRFYPDVSVAPDPANYATVSVYKRAADGTQTLVAHVDTSTRGWTAGVPVVLSIDAAPVLVDETLTYAVTKHGTGVVIPSGRFVVKLDQNFITTRIAVRQAMIEGRLRKRYAIPVAGNDVEIVFGWLADLVTLDGFNRLGRNPAGEQDAAAIDGPAAAALDAMKEAADSQNGLLDLALAPGTTGSGVSAGGPLGYTETSPYVAFDIQRDVGRGEDMSGAGTGDPQ